LIQQLSHLDPLSQDRVLGLVASVTDHDGVPPLAEHVLLHLRHGGDIADSHFLAEISGQLAGYAHLDLTDVIEGPSAEIVVSAEFRNKGIGSALLQAVKEVAGDRLRLWSHGDLPGAQVIAERHGFQRVRTVVQMRRSLGDPIPEIDPSIAIRSFLVGLDEPAWLSLNNIAFAGHPEQADWSERDFQIRRQESWFEPTGFLIAEMDGEMAGFCWTKVHGGHSHQHSPTDPIHDHDPIGEIYIMGVSPKFRQRGVGRAVTIAGLRYLRYQGIYSAMLYVDSSNASAMKLYQSLGFTEWGRDVLYRYTLVP
jgi:mycothiol synthase